MKTPEKWPSEGVVVFDNTYLKYSDVDPPVLKNLNIYIKNGWKVISEAISKTAPIKKINTLTAGR